MEFSNDFVMFDDEDGPSSLLKGGLVCAAITVVGLLAKGLLLSVLGLTLGSFLDLARLLSVGSWPAQRGYVEEWGVKYEKASVYSAWAVFLYEADGQVYRGWRPATSGLEFTSEANARQALTAFPIGQEIRVLVNPFNMCDAVLDPHGQNWLSLALRLAAGCLLLLLAGGALASFEVPDYAIALALCAMIALGGLCRAKTDVAAQQEALSTAQLWARQKSVAAVRTAWNKLKPGALVSSAPAVGEPDHVVTSPGGPQTWTFDRGTGMETSGKIMVLPSTKGWIVDRVFPPYTTLPGNLSK